MQDENTCEEIRCPYCGETEDCSHLLAVIDATFNYCPAGYATERYDEFHSIVGNVFLAQLRFAGQRDCSWSDSGLSEPWDYARQDYSDGDDEVSLDPYIMTRLIIRLLADAGGEKYPGPLTDGSEAPGFSSALELFYAKEPAEVLEAALVQLKMLLNIANC